MFKEWLDKLIVASLCAMIFTLPFSKSAVEIFFIVALISWILRRILSYKPGIPLAGLFKPISTPLNLSLYLFALVGFLSILTSVSIVLSLKGLFFKLLEGVLIYFIVAETIDDRKKLNSVLIVMILSMLLMCMDGIFQYITGRDFIRHYPFNGFRIQASFSNPNGFGGWIATMFPLALSLGFMNKNKQYKRIINAIAWVIICAVAVCLTLTYSRGAWIGAVLSVIFIGIFKIRKFSSIMIIILMIALFAVSPFLKERTNFSKTTKASYAIRSSLWQEALTIVEDFPILGCGINTYSVVAPHYKINEGGGVYPHNSYLQMTAEMGIVGLAAFSWLIFKLFKASLKNLKNIKDGFYSNVLIGLLAGMLAFLVHSFFDVNFYALQLAILMWFIMGLIVAVGRIALKEESRPGGYSA